PGDHDRWFTSRNIPFITIWIFQIANFGNGVPNRPDFGLLGQNFGSIGNLKNMLVTDLIRRKRDGAELQRSEIEFLINGYTRDEIPDYQISAWLMAVLLRGMTRAELAALTESMLNSGEVISFPELPAAKVDKHSTGGVG